MGPRDQNVVLAEIASCQMEYKYLAHLTGNRNYFLASDKTMNWFERNQLSNGMWETTWNVSTGKMSDGTSDNKGYQLAYTTLVFNIQC